MIFYQEYVRFGVPNYAYNFKIRPSFVRSSYVSETDNLIIENLK